MGGFKKLAIVGALTVAVVALVVLRTGSDTQKAEADWTSPGGISAIPSALPGFPFVFDQILPAIIPASGPGNEALVTGFLDPFIFGATSGVLGDADDDGDAQVTFDVVALDLATGGSSGTNARFAASGTQHLVCTDFATCDLTDTFNDGAIVVKLVGGGRDEILRVTSTDEFGDQRAVLVITVQTMLAAPPVLEPFTQVIPGLDDLAIIAYRCNDIGRSVFDVGGAAFVDTLQAMWDAFYFDYNGSGVGSIGANNFFRCGGDTSTTVDDFVQFETDKGIITIDPVSFFSFPTLGLGTGACDEGDSVSTNDGGLFTIPGPPLILETCDLDGAANGVVSQLLLDTGDTGSATIEGQQGTHGASTRSVNVQLVGVPSLAIDLAGIPSVIGVLAQTPIQVGVFSTQAGTGPAPVAGITVVCSVAPADSAFALLPDRDTTGSDGMADMQLVPTGLPGTTFTITCRLDGHPEVSPVSKEVGLSLSPDRETVNLITGCNLVAFMPAYDDGTALSVVAGDVAGGSPRIWLQKSATEFDLFDPDSVERSTVTTLTKEAGFICVDEDTTWSRPRA